jgi:MFS family permease
MSIYTVYLISFFNMSSLRASKVLVTLFALKLGAGELVVGALIATYAVSPMLLALFAGRLADRVGVRMPMLVGSVGSAVGLSIPFFFASVPALFVSAVVIGTSYVFYHVSVQQLVGMLSTPETRTRTFSQYSLVLAVGSLVGPLAAGFGIDQIGHQPAYAVFACMPLVALALIVCTPALRGMKGESGGDGDKRIRDLFANPAIRRVLIVSGIALAGNDLFLFYMPVYGNKVGLTATQIGLVLAAFASAAFVVRVVIPALARRLGEARLLTLCLMIGGATYLLFPAFSNPWALAAVGFALGLTMGCGQPLSVMLTYGSAPEGRTGETLGMRLLIMHFTQMTVPVTFGAVGAFLGIGPVFWAIAALLVGGGWLSRGAGR